MFLIAIVLPFLAMFLKGKPIQGVLCLILQVTVVGWLPAAVWAILVVNAANADDRTDRIVEATTKA